MPPEVEDLFRARAFAIIEQYLRSDLEAVFALVGDDDAELLPIPVKILTEASLVWFPARKLSARSTSGLMSGVPG